MKFSRLILGLILAALMLAPVGAQNAKPSLEADLQRAIEKETVSGDLKAAIETYKRIVSRAGRDRAIAAKALLAMAECYRRLGDVQAKRVYEQIIAQFPDQADALATARTQLTTLGAAGNGATVTAHLVSAAFLDSVSRDGRFGAFENKGNNDIGVRDMKTGNVKYLGLHAHADTPMISPDGSRILFGLYPPKDTSTLNIVANQVGATPRTLISNPDIDYFIYGSWSPDGKSVLVATRRQDQTWQLAWIDVATRAMTVLTSLNWRFNEGGFDLSPDGRYVAYAAFPVNPSRPNPQRIEAPDTYIYVLPSRGSGQETVLVKNAGNNLYPLWSADGSHVLFQKTGNVALAESRDLWAIGVQNGKASGAAAPVKAHVGDPVGITQAGTYYYATGSMNADVAIVPLNSLGPGGGPTTGDVIAGGMNAGWSPDGKSVAVRRVTHADRNIFDMVVHSLESGEERTFAIDPPNGVGADAPIWLHDGSGILVSVFSPASTPLGFRTTWQRLDLKTGKFSDVVSVGLREALFGGALSSDDRTLYFSRQQADEGPSPDTIVAFDLTTHREQVVTALSTPRSAQERRSPLFPHLFLSADGRKLAFSLSTIAAGNQIFTIGVDGSGAKEAYHLPIDQRFELLGWGADGHSVLFEEGSQILRVSADGGSPQPTGMSVREPETPAANRGIPFEFLSPDGTRLAVARFSSTGQVWAIDHIPALVNATQR
jgi:Tol biopolymer transport system component